MAKSLRSHSATGQRYRCCFGCRVQHDTAIYVALVIGFLVAAKIDITYNQAGAAALTVTAEGADLHTAEQQSQQASGAGIADTHGEVESPTNITADHEVQLLSETSLEDTQAPLLHTVTNSTALAEDGEMSSTRKLSAYLTDISHESAINQHSTPNVFDSLSCPAWMREYIAFHQSQRGAPGAKYLVYSARKYSSGLGDRLKGMISVTRFAVATKRVVLFTWHNDPVEPQEYLSQAGFIDWTLSGIPYDPTTAKNISGFSWQREEYAAFQQLLHGGLHNETAQFVNIQTNISPKKGCQGCPGTSYHGESPEVCLFHLLFKPSAALSQLADQELVKLYGPQALEPGFRYVAAHLRLGGLPKEPAVAMDSRYPSLGGPRGLGESDLQDFLALLQRAREACDTAGVNITEVPILLLVDNHAVREFIQAKQLTHVITTDAKPLHLAHTEGTGTEEERLLGVQSAYVDLMLLARARCLIAGRSGFSHTASLMATGYGGCYTVLNSVPIS